jgi:DNA-binding transcriptional LysR family regulator
MNQKHLEYFLALSKIGNITHAADSLYLTRQALSNSIKELEQELGASLFVRSKSGVELTDIGKQVQEFAEQMTLSWQRLVEEAHRTAQKKIIRVGTHLMHLDVNTLNAITEFQVAEPDVKITFYDDEDYTVFWRMLNDRELDIAYTRKAPESASFRWIKLEDYQVFVFVSTDNPLSQRKRIDFMEDLKGQTYLSVSRDTSKEIEPYIRLAGINHEYVTPSPTLLKRLIESDSGIFVAPGIAISTIATKGITAIELDNFPIDISAYLVYKPNPPEYIQRYIEYIKGHPKKMS